MRLKQADALLKQVDKSLAMSGLLGNDPIQRLSPYFQRSTALPVSQLSRSSALRNSTSPQNTSQLSVPNDAESNETTDDVLQSPVHQQQSPSKQSIATYYTPPPGQNFNYGYQQNNNNSYAPSPVSSHGSSPQQYIRSTPKHQELAETRAIIQQLSVEAERMRKELDSILKEKNANSLKQQQNDRDVDDNGDK